MKNDPISLDALCRTAGAQAAGWGTERPVQATRATTAAVPLRKRLVAFALLGGASAVALAFAAERFFAPPPASVAAPSPIAAAPRVGVELTPLPPAATLETVRWEGAELVVDFDRTPLQDAITLLARATRTTVEAGRLPEPPAVVTLHLRTRDAPVAWQRLLQGRPGFGIACTAAGCQLSMAAGTDTAAAAPTSGPRDRVPAAAAPLPEDPVARQQQLELQQSQPDGAC